MFLPDCFTCAAMRAILASNASRSTSNAGVGISDFVEHRPIMVWYSLIVASHRSRASLSLVQLTSDAAPPQQLQRELAQRIQGEVRFDRFPARSIPPTPAFIRSNRCGVVIPKSAKTSSPSSRSGPLRCPITMRGGGTSQAGQAIGEGVCVDTFEILQPRSRSERRASAGHASSPASCSTN